MKRKNAKRSESRFTPYLDEDEYLVWVGEAKSNGFFPSFAHALAAVMFLGCSAVATIAVFYQASFLIILPLIPLTLSIAYIIEIRQSSYYAISNKRLFVLQGNRLEKVEDLRRLQQISIAKTKRNHFSLVLLKRAFYDLNQTTEQELPVYIPQHELKDLSEEAAQTAYDLLMAEREERKKGVDLWE
jgi:hypothetical protein